MDAITEEHIRGMCIRHAVVHVLTSVGILLFFLLCFSLFTPVSLSSLFPLFCLLAYSII